MKKFRTSFTFMFCVIFLAVLFQGINVQGAVDFEKGIECGEVYDTSTAQPAADLGAKWVRLNFIVRPEWSGPDDPGFIACYDVVVNSYHSKGLKIIGLIGAQSVKNGYDRNNPATFVDPLRNAAVSIIGRYRGFGLKVYEIFNEPNDWAGGSSSQVTPYWFARFLEVVYEQKYYRGWNDVTIVSGPILSGDFGTGRDYIYQTYQMGMYYLAWDWFFKNAGTYPLDAVGYHMYVYQGSTNASDITARMNAWLADFWQGIKDGENLRGFVPNCKKRIWISEIGWESDIVGEQGQAQNLTTAFNALKNNANVRMGMWFTMNEYLGFGLFRSDGTRKPAWNAFAQFGSYPKIAMRAAANNRYVCAENAGNASLIANRTAIGLWETFDLIDLGSGNVALKSWANGKYVCAENAGNSPLIANRTAIGLWETFKLINLGNGNIALRSLANNKYVCAENGGNAPLIANRTAIGLWETFQLIYF